jgi:hypothetical protein
MRLYLNEDPTSRGFVPIHGPADLAGKSGAIRVSGTPADDDEASRWAVSIGLFVARGGEVRRLT